MLLRWYGSNFIQHLKTWYTLSMNECYKSFELFMDGEQLQNFVDFVDSKWFWYFLIKSTKYLTDGKFSNRFIVEHWCEIVQG